MARFLNILFGVVFFLFGIYMWNNPTETFITYSFYLGLLYVIWTIITIFYIFKRKIKPVPYGNIIVSIIISIAILALPMFSIAMVLWTFVFIFLISAVYYLRNVIKNGLKSHLLQFILACIAVIYGFVMLFNPIVAGNTIAKILAFFDGDKTVEEINLSTKPILFPQEIKKLEEFIKDELSINDEEFKKLVIEISEKLELEALSEGRKLTDEEIDYEYVDFLIAEILETLKDDVCKCEVECGVPDCCGTRVEKNLKKVYEMALYMLREGISYEDLTQEGIIGLIKAHELFEDDKDFKLYKDYYILYHPALYLCYNMFHLNHMK